MVAVARQLMVVPAQAGLGVAVMETVTGAPGVTLSGNGALVAGFPEVHRAEEVRVTRMVSPGEGVQV